MEIIAEDENGRHLFVIFIHEILNDPIIYGYKSNLPDFIFELRTINPLLNKLLTPGLTYRVQKYYADCLVNRIKKVRRIERWFLKDEMLTADKKLSRAYYFTVENIMERMTEPTGVPFTLHNMPYVFESFIQLIETVKKYNPFQKIDRFEFEKYIQGNFYLESAYVEQYSSVNKFYRLKAEMNIEGKILVFLTNYGNIQLIFLFQAQ